MKYVYNLAFKMSISAVGALILSNVFSLQFATVAAVIAILSIQDNRKKALIVSKNRMIAAIIVLTLSIIIYKIIGQNSIGFGIILLIFIPLTSKLKIEEGMVASVVLSTHLFMASSIDISLIINEIMLMIIGTGMAAIANFFMPSLENEFKNDRIWIEEEYRIIFSMMSKELLTHIVDINEQKIIDRTKERLLKTKKTAYTIANNNFYKSNSYYTDYINMRINQFDVIQRMRLHLQKFNIPVEQMELMGEFTMKVSESISEENDCNELLEELERLRTIFKNMDLPKTREEFESRAELLQFLNGMEEFLEIKRNYFID